MLSLPNKVNIIKNKNNDNSEKLQEEKKDILQSDLITIQKLKSSVLDYQTETNKLNNEIEILKAQNNRLIEENQNLSVLLKVYEKKESLFLLTKESLEKVKEENESLNSILLKERDKFNFELRLKDSLYDRDVSQANIKNETLKHQNDMFLNVKKLNDILYLKNNELKKNIEELKEEEKIKLDKMEIKYNKKFDNYKRKMIEFLKKNEEARYKLGTQAELNGKLKVLHMQELINELEMQGVEVEDLLKERQELKLKIMELNHDLFIYKKVIDTMTKKNHKFQNKIKKISNNIREYKLLSFSQSKYDKKKKIITEPNENSVNIKEYNIARNCSVNDKNIIKIIENNDLLTTSNKKSMPSSGKNKMKLVKIDNENNNFNKTTYNCIRSNINNDRYKIKDGKNYDILYKEKEKFKDLYEFYKEKYDLIIRQYSNIFNIYNNVLKKIYNEEIVKKNKENIMINLNEFKEFNFENMNSEQKYAILVKLINNIAPIVYKKDIEDNLFNQNVSKIKEKYNFNGINSINSLNFSSQNSTNIPSTPLGLKAVNMKLRTSNNINDSFRTTTSFIGKGIRNNKSLNSFDDFKKIMDKQNENRNKSLYRFGKSKIDIDLIQNVNLFLD
mgnify:CR=1 FL=1